jgi:type II secretory ATPase GspE/PulE/Tfp pilus assembly ATPase PilB-like protein
MSYIKAMAGMDIAEHRRPLDGRWVSPCLGTPTLDLRISTMPTLYGEDMSLRLLQRHTRLMELDRLGLPPQDLARLLALLANSGGLLLATGPTACGKTTTLYACLHHLNDGKRKINTIEDPIEYALEGVRQSQVNVRLEVGFPELLRGVLRQAPDVIMVGEIRDATTAETAVRAANSGHLVLATLHAPVAAGAAPSLLNLGVQPHLLASSLLGVVSQRLVRTLCPKCKIRVALGSAPDVFDEIRAHLRPGEGECLYEPRGCAACHRLGFSGRTGLFEVLTVTSTIRRLIVERRPLQVINRQAVEEGLIPFRQLALLKVARGETSLAEVLRAVPAEALDSEG